MHFNSFDLINVSEYKVTNIIFPHDNVDSIWSLESGQLIEMIGRLDKLNKK